MKNSNWLHMSSFIIIWWMKTSLCWKLDNDNVLYTNRDIAYNCALNTMCRCFPNETNLLQISCNEITLYKLPGELKRFLPFLLKLDAEFRDVILYKFREVLQSLFFEKFFQVYIPWKNTLRNAFWGKRVRRVILLFCVIAGKSFKFINLKAVPRATENITRVLEK